MYLDNSFLCKLKKKSIKLLKDLIKIPSISGEENKVSEYIVKFLIDNGIKNIKRKYNNIWVYNNNYSNNECKTILINSHHDTVKPGLGWKTNPFYALCDKKKIIGLGSNDAGGALVSIIAAFIYLNQIPNIYYKLILVITAEEEISGNKGIKSILPYLNNIDLGIIGEPTNMQLAIAEKGLIVLDCFSYGKTGHIAKNNGVNALYLAIDDIQKLRKYHFKKKSNILGETKINISQIESGIQHNIVPDKCHFVVDIRTNERYKNQEIINLLKKKIQSKIFPRSYLLNSSFISNNHPIVKKAISLKIKLFGSPTLSDQSLMPFPTVKIGPGCSSRSHTSNEYILDSEIYKAIDLYIKILKDFSL